LELHLLPYFKDFPLTAIKKRTIDEYKTVKAAEGRLGANQINATLVRMSQILSLAEEYELVPSNVAAGKRRRLPATKPRRAWVEPEQLPSLLDAAVGLRCGRGRPLLATLAGSGVRIGEALALQRRHVNLAAGTLR